MSSYRPIDSKREEFRKYLEKAGALDALTKVLVMLYDEPEKPTDALDYIRKHLGDNKTDEAEIETLRADAEASLLKIQSLEEEVKVLKEKLAQYEPEDKSTQQEEPEPENIEPVVDSTDDNVQPADADNAGDADAAADAAE